MYSINSSGNNVSSNSGSITYSIGQVFFSNMGDNNYKLAEGIQNGNQEENSNNEDSDVPEDDFSSKANVLIYPNPTTDFITLVTEGFNFNNQLNSYQLYNYQGKLINQSLIENQNSRIDLSNLSASIYILQVFAEENLLKTFKIVKQ
ncbi:Por secretion system C-terminal sorting domain-containing protein [Flaviramulus basaltis]|uniref:Por secretion system C-terminal sorting domain-containing protein n=2 Tax=Flaviramulus basaltis TaxID=369401 RepID=A0A1K2INM3_9FLAO|nr:Por secretion system C-terminal sorting domain-containing protein [Flaviramulus basaltis]